MKIIYKILFSLCSTIVCCAHSARAFAASCSIFSNLPVDACSELGITYGALQTCNPHALQGFVLLHHDTYRNCNIYGAVYECKECAATHPEKKRKSYHIASAAANCDITYYTCTTTTQPTGTCTKNADCVSVLGSSVTTAYLPDYDTGEEDVAYVIFSATCTTNKNCLWIISTTADWDIDASNGYGELLSTAKCTNAKYGRPTIISEAGNLYARYCNPCPDIDATFIGGNADYLRGTGTAITSCYIDAGAQFQDLSGRFETMGRCDY